MTVVLHRNAAWYVAVLLGIGMMFVVVQRILGQQSDQNIMFTRGQNVLPIYQGWHPNPDGTIDLWFGYLNQNWQEQLDIPVGPDNRIDPAPYGPDAGQPTHFLPRNSRWVFSVRVPKDFGDKEIVWTLTSHGQTHSSYATLKAGYIHDDMGMQREFFGTPPANNKPPILHVEGDRQRTIKVGQPVTLTAVATDDGLPRTRADRPQGADGAGDAQATQGPRGGVAIGGDGTRQVAKGLRLAWYVYRGANVVKFDPPQFKTWEDQRGGSPWAPSWVNPPIPPGNKWIVQATFREPGTYVLRCQASDGLWYTEEGVTFTVTP